MGSQRGKTARKYNFLVFSQICLANAHDRASLKYSNCRVIPCNFHTREHGSARALYCSHLDSLGHLGWSCRVPTLQLPFTLTWEAV
ncbi:hypothetical protein FKM82_022079 [Ascaphus truei]